MLLLPFNFSLSLSFFSSLLFLVLRVLPRDKQGRAKCLDLLGARRGEGSARQKASAAPRGIRERVTSPDAYAHAVIISSGH